MKGDISQVITILQVLLGTRGVTVGELKHSVWLRGPEWVMQPLQETQANQEDILIIEPEETYTQTTNYGNAKQLIKWERFSQLKRLRNMVKRVLCWKKGDWQLSAETLNLAELGMLVQMKCIPDDWKQLSQMTELSNSNLIGTLSPFVADKVIRTRGPLRKSKLSLTQKQPILLSSQHPAVKFHLQFMYDKYHHQGIEFFRSVTQKLRNSLRAIKRRCVQCKLQRWKNIEQ